MRNECLPAFDDLNGDLPLTTFVFARRKSASPQQNVDTVERDPELARGLARR
jgi:hypothetical protein